MSDWIVGSQTGFHSWYYKIKKIKGTDYQIEILPHEEGKSIKLWVGISSGNKRKHLDSYEYENINRKGGIEALMWIKSQVLKFPAYYISQGYTDHKKVILCVAWEDKRRKDIYCRSLIKEGFRLGVIDRKQVLIKRIK